MSIGTVQQPNYKPDYAGYTSTGDAKTDAFYRGMSSAVEEADERGTGDVLGLTMLPYSDDTSYGMSSFYSENSTPEDPVVRINCNYGGENRYFDVHVNEVDPHNASQIEMFALSCYCDDNGITDGGTFGSYTKMKAYAGNASHLEQGYDLQDLANVNVKMDWIAMLQKMAQEYLGNPQTYSQYLDCGKLVAALESLKMKEPAMTQMQEDREHVKTEKKPEFNEMPEHEKEATDVIDEVAVRTVIECSVVSLPEQGISFYFNEKTGEMSCVDDTNRQAGRQSLWSKVLSKEELADCEKLFERYKGEKHWEYRYANYLKQEEFWDKFLADNLFLEKLEESKS